MAKKLTSPSKLTLFCMLCIFFGLYSCENNVKIISYETALTKCEDVPEGMFSMPSCLIGAGIPKFQAQSINNKKIDQKYFEKKITIINFWFTGCEPCIAEIPGLNKIVSLYGKNEINYLAISRDNSESVKTFLDRHKWNFDHIANGRKLIEDIFASKWGYPLTIVVNKRGTIIGAFSGGRTDSLASNEIFIKLSSIIDNEKL